MPSYIEIEDLTPLIPEGWLVEALDDDGDDEQESFDGVATAAENAVNGMLSTQYSVPIGSPENFPFLKHVTVHEAARLCYARRGYAEDKFPHFKAWERAWQQLTLIGRGELQLGPAAEGNASIAKPRGSVITGPSKTHDSAGRLSA